MRSSSQNVTRSAQQPGVQGRIESGERGRTVAVATEDPVEEDLPGCRSLRGVLPGLRVHARDRGAGADGGRSQLKVRRDDGAVEVVARGIERPVPPIEDGAVAGRLDGESPTDLVRRWCRRGGTQANQTAFRGHVIHHHEEEVVSLRSGERRGGYGRLQTAAD